MLSSERILAVSVVLLLGVVAVALLGRDAAPIAESESSGAASAGRGEVEAVTPASIAESTGGERVEVGELETPRRPSRAERGRLNTPPVILVHGSVTDEAGVPIPHARVRLQRSSVFLRGEEEHDGTIDLVVHANANGGFTIHERPWLRALAERGELVLIATGERSSVGGVAFRPGEEVRLVAFPLETVTGYVRDANGGIPGNVRVVCRRHGPDSHGFRMADEPLEVGSHFALELPAGVWDFVAYHQFDDGEREVGRLEGAVVERGHTIHHDLNPLTLDCRVQRIDVISGGSDTTARGRVFVEYADGTRLRQRFERHFWLGMTDDLERVVLAPELTSGSPLVLEGPDVPYAVELSPLTALELELTGGHPELQGRTVTATIGIERDPPLRDHLVFTETQVVGFPGAAERCEVPGLGTCRVTIGVEHDTIGWWPLETVHEFALEADRIVQREAIEVVVTDDDLEILAMTERSIEETGVTSHHRR